METELIINHDYKPKIIENLDEQTYHSDKTAVNSSSLKSIFHSEKSWLHEYNKDFSPPKSDALEFGKLIHKMVLEGSDFIKRYVVEPVFEGFTLDGKPSTRSKDVLIKKAEWAEEQIKNDRIICTQSDFDKARWMIDSFLGHSDAFNLIKDGMSEVSGYSAHQDTGLLCRARADFFSPSEGILVDLKTCIDIRQDFFLKQRVVHKDYRYDLQQAMYKDVFDQNLGKEIKFFVWIVLESKKPFECAVYFAPKDLMLASESYYNHAMKKISIANKRNEFYPYQSAIQELTLPDDYWYLNEAMRLES